MNDRESPQLLAFCCSKYLFILIALVLSPIQKIVEYVNQCDLLVFNSLVLLSSLCVPNISTLSFNIEEKRKLFFFDNLKNHFLQCFQKIISSKKFTKISFSSINSKNSFLSIVLKKSFLVNILKSTFSSIVFFLS